MAENVFTISEEQLAQYMQEAVDRTKKELEAAWGEKDNEKVAELETQLKEFIETQQEQKKTTPVTTEEDPAMKFKSLGDFAQAVYRHKTNPDPRLVKMIQKDAGDGMNETVDSEGGFLIPEENSTELLSASVEKAQLFNRCTIIYMRSNSMTIPYLKDTDRSNSQIYGGVQIYWIEDEGSYTASKPSVGRIRLNLHKMGGLAYVTDDMLEDSPQSLEIFLNDKFSDAIAWAMDSEILNGSGSGRPQGILNAAAINEVSAESGQDSTTFIYENAVNMYARMPAANRAKAVWVMNDDVLPQLLTMNLAVGTGGGPVYMPPGGASASPYGTLLGKPIIYTEHCQTLGTAGDVYFADFSAYLIGQKTGGGVKTSSSIHLKFDYDQTAFKFTYRVDGKSWWPDKRTPAHGSNYVSPFVDLAAR